MRRLSLQNYIPYTDNIPTDNIPIDNIPTENTPKDNTTRDNIPTENIPTDNIPIRHGVDWTHLHAGPSLAGFCVICGKEGAVGTSRYP